MTKEERELIKEYKKLLDEYQIGHARLKWVKQRMAKIRSLVVIPEKLVDERSDEIILKEPYSR